MRYYCPKCWHDFYNKDFQVCPECGYNIKAFNDKDYVNKLIGALDHRVVEIRHWAIMALALQKTRKAIPHLKKIVEESKDVLLVKAAEEAIIKISQSGNSNA